MGRGRPSKYKKQYCSDLVEHMSSGGSYETFGAFIGEKYGSEMMVSKQTLYDWEKKHPEFLDSKKRGFACSQLFYEQVGIKGMMGEIKGLRRINSF